MTIPAMLLVAANFTANYDCTLETPKALRQPPAQVALDPIQFPDVAEGDWKFRAEVKQNDDGLNVRVVWPKNPIQLAGSFAGLPTADGSIAFMTYGMGPCMFTESACMSLVNLVDAGNGTARVIVTPAALTSDGKDASTREPFVVVIMGKCTRNGNVK